MDFQEIVKELNLQGISQSEFGEADMLNPLPVIGEWKSVDETGGNEGGGEYCDRVIHFIDHDVYIFLEGFYTSFNGSDWDDHSYKEVRPVEKTITVYE